MNYRPKYCECNTCGLEVKLGNKFILGHHGRGKHPSEETIKKQSKSQLIAQNRPEVREKRSKSEKIAQNRPEVKEKQSKSAIIVQNCPEVKEKHRITNALPEVKEKRSKAQIIAQNRSDVKEKKSKASKITQNLPDVREKTKRSLEITNIRPEVKKRRSKSAKIARTKQWQDPEYAAMMCKAQNSTETVEKRSKSIKVSQIKLWQDPEYKEKQLFAMGKGLEIFPNKPEIFLMNVLDNLYPGEWKYTGDFSFIIGGKNPDFVNINGQKKCIEHYGTYWHKDHDPQDRINLFKSYGWNCLIIWEHELRDFKSLRRKIFDFVEAKCH